MNQLLRIVFNHEQNDGQSFARFLLRTLQLNGTMRILCVNHQRETPLMLPPLNFLYLIRPMQEIKLTMKHHAEGYFRFS